MIGGSGTGVINGFKYFALRVFDDENLAFYDAHRDVVE